jgi:hypothetical protein
MTLALVIFTATFAVLPAYELIVRRRASRLASAPEQTPQ